MKSPLSSNVYVSNAEAKLLRLKGNLTNELITSEIKYISYLKKVLKYFARPLCDHRYLPEDIHAEIFGRLVPILNVNETLLESLLTVGVEKAFLKISPCLKLYADYARRYQTNVVFMETCITFTPGLLEFINKQENLPDVNLQLAAFLIMPIQRVPRYSLMLQELVTIYLQLDGLTSTEANDVAVSITQAAHHDNMIPEYAATLILKLWENYKQRGFSSPSNSSNFPVVRSYVHRMKPCTIILLAGFASVVSTATFLNEQIRISEQATKAALLQSRLLGKWSRNLILVPGRKLLKYGIVKKKNSLDGVAEPRLLVILSDILVYATPRTQTDLESIFSNKLVVGRKYPEFLKSFSAGKTPLKCVKLMQGRNKAYPLTRVSKYSTPVRSENSVSQSLLDSDDCLTNSKVCFSCVSVYPLHHCHIQVHFRTSSTFLQPIPESPENRSNKTNSVFVSPGSTVNFHNRTASTPLVFDGCSCDASPVVKFNKFDSSIKSDKDEELSKPCQSVNEYSFSVHCRDASFTIVTKDLAGAEEWISSLETAIEAVKTARQSLRKESSAKWPMRASDFIQFEQWLEQKRSAEESMKCSEIFQSMGVSLIADDSVLASSNILDSSKVEKKLEEYRRLAVTNVIGRNQSERRPVEFL
uniref:DH domain-containing protein n=1 Tax=Trichobilharzia regenti TaxID=157069 RepID=A0AA85JW30_TRIRE|nr:unnamed protein product [Trichobilharzia regenti]